MVLFPGCSCCGPCTHCAADCLRATFSGWAVDGGGLDLLTRIDGAAFTLVRTALIATTVGGHTFSDGACRYESAKVCAWVPIPGRGSFAGGVGYPAWMDVPSVWAELFIDATHVGFRIMKRQAVNGAGETGDFTVLDVAIARDAETDHRHACTDLVFGPWDTSGGTVTIAAGDCEEPSHGPACTMPESITLALAGMGDVVSYRPASAEDSICDDSAVIYNLTYMGLGSTPPSGYLQGKLTENGEAVLDLVSGSCPPWTYAGVLPVPTCPASWPEGLDARDLTPRPVVVTVAPIDASTTVVVDAPTRGGTTATAQISGIGAGGAITGITRLTGGSGYAVRRVDIVEPTVTATVAGGTTAATLAVTMAPREGVDPARWEVASVSVEDGGTGFPLSVDVAFSTDDSEEWPATATAWSGRVEPTLAIAVVGGSGAGAALTPILSPDGSGAWAITGATVEDGGSGYTGGESITITVVDGDTLSEAFLTPIVDTFEESPTFGQVTGVSIGWGGAYAKATGVLESVTGVEGFPPGGSYWREELTEIVDSDTPTVAILSPTGSGATATATIDTTIGSATFGQITGFTLGAGGTAYMEGDAWLLTATIAAGPAAAFRHLDCTRCDTAACRPGCVPSDAYGAIADPFAGDCAASVSRLLPIANRVSKETCPTELLDRDYPLYLQSGIRWLHKYEGVATYCSPGGAAGDPPEHPDGVTVFEFAAGAPIKATVAPA